MSDADPSTSAIVSLEGVSRRFRGGVEAVRRLDFSVRKGEFIALVGPSGCGKTTALRLIAGLDRPDEGVIRLNGMIMNGRHPVPPHKRGLSMLFQDALMYPHMSVRRNLRFTLGQRGQAGPDIERMVDGTSRMLGIEQWLDRRPGELSGGQRRRAALARAVITRPRLLLLDEPLSGLDLPSRLGLRRELRDIATRLGMTTICVTHDQDDALAMGDRVALMDHGRIIQSGPPESLHASPVNRAVAAFFGVPPINFLLGSVETNSYATIVRIGAGSVIRLSARQAKALARGSHRSVILGIRPAHLRPVDPTTTPGIQAMMVATEAAGDHWIVRARLDDGSECLIRSPDRPASPMGEALHLSVDPDRVLLFAADESGRNLLLTDELRSDPPLTPHSWATG